MLSGHLLRLLCSLLVSSAQAFAVVVAPTTAPQLLQEAVLSAVPHGSACSVGLDAIERPSEQEREDERDREHSAVAKAPLEPVWSSVSVFAHSASRTRVCPSDSVNASRSARGPPRLG